MTDFLVNKFVKNSENIFDVQVRKKYGYLSGGIGITCNIILFLLKFFTGILSNSIAITVDAFNNLSDVGSSMATIIGFKLTSKPPDKEHPFGHGRIEYIAALIIAAMVMYVGIEFFMTSIDRIKNPKAVSFSYIGLAVIVVSILIKLWMAGFNKKIGTKIGSKTMEATAADSISDVISTAVVGLSFIISNYTQFPIDGYIGILVSIFILYNAYKIAVETISPLLGEAPDPKLVEEIEKRLLTYEYIVGTHDLIVHSYGPGRRIATVHAEVPDSAGIVEVHDVIDNAEKEISFELGIELIIHMDPINTKDEEVLYTKSIIESIIKETDNRLNFHDFRMVKGTTHTNIIFDLVTAMEANEEQDYSIKQEITKKIKEHNKQFNVIITVDKPYN